MINLKFVATEMFPRAALWMLYIMQLNITPCKSIFSYPNLTFIYNLTKLCLQIFLSLKDKLLFKYLQISLSLKDKLWLHIVSSVTGFPFPCHCAAIGDQYSSTTMPVSSFTSRNAQIQKGQDCGLTVYEIQTSQEVYFWLSALFYILQWVYNDCNDWSRRFQIILNGTMCVE